MHFDATFWVGFAFVLFIGILIYYKVHHMLTKGLDERAERIRNELDEARALREEARSLLANYERKQRDALKEAEAIVTAAEDEAKREAADGAAKLDALLARREQAALDKIRLAEQQALQEVREAAVDIAVEAAGKVIGNEMQGDRAASYMDASISNIRQQIN